VLVAIGIFIRLRI
jgi:MFS transporter, MHS family, shikimate and dehydroshikimate transport protein